MFKDVTIKGKLYSSEFRQLFKTGGKRYAYLVLENVGNFQLDARIA